VIFPRSSLRTARWFSLSILSAFVAVTANSASREPVRAQPLADARFEALPLTRTKQNHLMVRAFINDKPALLIVDTGSPGTVISSKRCSFFHVGNVPRDSDLPARVQVNGSYNRLVMARSLRLGGLNVSDVPAVAVDLRGARKSSRATREVEADGILGADVLFASKAVLDCQKQLLVLDLQPDMPGKAPGFDYRGFEKMPIVVSEGYNLYVDGAVNGAPARMMIDTGAFATLLHRPFVRHLRIPTEETELQSAAINLKQEGIDIARIRKLSFGLVNITGKDVGVVDLGGVLHDGLQNKPPTVGLLGAEILRRNHGIIDFGTRTFYLRGEAAAPRKRASARRARVTQTVTQRLLVD
jgi:predicted aspartyl protease